jgi:putative transposase
MYPEFTNVYYSTATILHWKPLLANDEYKDLIIESLRFCVTHQRANIWAFVIMENHIHLVWQILEPYTLSYVQGNMHKYIAQRIIHDLWSTNNDETLNQFLVRKKDRHFQIWKRNPMNVEILTDDFLWQKINYIHMNRSRKGYNDIEYKYSSAHYYLTGIKNWDFLI